MVAQLDRNIFWENFRLSQKKPFEEVERLKGAISVINLHPIAETIGLKFGCHMLLVNFASVVEWPDFYNHCE